MLRVDAHHHVWQIARGDYGWLKPVPELAAIHRDFGIEDLQPLLAPHGIDATVLVQAAPTVAETIYLLDIAHANRGLVRGVVGWADLAAADAIATLEALATDPLLKGIRPMLQDIPDGAWIARPAVRRALAALPGLGLRLDALVTSRELKPLLETLNRHPDLAVVIDHCAKPAIAAGAWQPWAADLAAIARDTAARCKLSGLLTEAGAAWSADTLRPYVDHVLAAFGSERVIWGSDWPVVTLASGYSRWVEATDTLLAGLPSAARADILGGNARRFYGLSD